MSSEVFIEEAIITVVGDRDAGISDTQIVIPMSSYFDLDEINFVMDQLVNCYSQILDGNAQVKLRGKHGGADFSASPPKVELSITGKSQDDN